jgi:tetraacyldisaccharide 4'-kinase
MKRIQDIWFGRGAGSLTVRAALWPLERAYDIAQGARSKMYDSGMFEVQMPALPTVSIGNLTTGGTGKTPFAGWLASQLSSLGAHPAIAMRGYGGDEQEVHRRLNPKIPVVVNANRAAAVIEAKVHGADVVVLDDAFQHRRIARSVDIVLLSVEQLMRPRRLLPSGPWREHLSAARRADLLVLTRKSASSADAERMKADVRKEIPKVPIVVVHMKPGGLASATGALTLPIDRLRGAAVLAVAAIGEPSVFQRQLEDLGASVTLAAYRDHHKFTDAEVKSLATHVPQDGLALCTLKDAVKLADRWPGPSRLWYVSQELVVEQGVEDLNRLLKRALDARAAAATTAG